MRPSSKSITAMMVSSGCQSASGRPPAPSRAIRATGRRFCARFTSGTTTGASAGTLRAVIRAAPARLAAIRPCFAWRHTAIASRVPPRAATNIAVVARCGIAAPKCGPAVRTKGGNTMHSKSKSQVVALVITRSRRVGRPRACAAHSPPRSAHPGIRVPAYTSRMLAAAESSSSGGTTAPTANRQGVGLPSSGASVAAAPARQRRHAATAAATIRSIHGNRYTGSSTRYFPGQPGCDSV